MIEIFGFIILCIIAIMYASFAYSAKKESHENPEAVADYHFYLFMTQFVLFITIASVWVYITSH